MTGVPFDKNEGHPKLVQCFKGLPPAPGARLWRNSVGYTPTTRKVAGIRVGLTAILPVVILSPQSGEDLQYVARSTRDLPMYALISKRGGEEP